MTAQQERKQHIRAFMQAHYTDERLAQLLAHAQDGKLEFTSCCCFVGIPFADHALHYHGGPVERGLHYGNFRNSIYEDAFLWLGYQDEGRRRVLIPMIRAEMKRRAALAAQLEVSTTVQRVAEPAL